MLRLCSVFEPRCDDVGPAQAEFDPIGGMQNHTANLVRALDRRGVTQTVVTSRLGGPAGCTSLGQHAEIHRTGLPIRSLRQLWAACGVLQALRAERVDLVHAHQGEDIATLPLALAAARYHGCPLVVTLHTSVGLTVPSRGVKLAVLHRAGGPVEGSILGRSDAVIALTEATASRLGAVRARTTVIPSGVEPDRFDASPAALLEHISGPRILFLGRLARQKDVPTLIQAFGRLIHIASLIVIGDGPHRSAVDAEIAALPLAVRERVHRFDFQPHERVPSLLAAADLLVLPSIYEEMGSILVEAMQAGLPVVATRVGGIPHVVEDGETGLLVPPRDAAALGDAIDALLGDPERRASMRLCALTRAGRYDWNTLAERVLDVYGAAIAVRGRHIRAP